MRITITIRSMRRVRTLELTEPEWLRELIHRIQWRCFKHDWSEWRPSLDGMWDTRRCHQCGKPQRVRKVLL